jgi:pimeloyl-ACP methyl ester carboxylesterase
VKTFVLFIQGGGEGAYEADAVLAKSLQRALGDEYDVRYPQMPDESNPDMQTWKTKISRELEALNGRVMLVGHSMGGATTATTRLYRSDISRYMPPDYLAP